MAETVEKRMQLFAPAILKLQQSNIFSPEEINKLQNKIRKNEYRLLNGTKDDYKSAVRYDQGVLGELKRRIQAKPGPNKNAHLEWIFIKRIVNTYKRGLIIFSTDYDFNMEYFDFLRHFPDDKHRHWADEHVKEMIQKFQHKPEVFRKGAAWFYLCGKLDETRSLLLRGQSLHPQNLEIYFDLIELEIKNITAKGVQNRMKKYIDTIVKNNVTHRFLEEAVKVFENYDNLQDTVNYCIEQLLNKYKNEVGVYEFVALRELKGNYYPPGDEDKRSTMYSIERCILRFKEGLLKLPNDKKADLWRKYLDMLVDLQKDCRNDKTIGYLKEALQAAEAEDIKMDESHYLAWLDCCKNNKTLLVKKLEEGTKKHSKSVMLWALYLRHHVLQDQTELARQVFERSITALGPNATKIWEIFIDFHLLRSPEKEVDALYERAIRQPHAEITSVFKPRYLVFTVATKGLDAARSLYLSIVYDTPYCKQLHVEMFMAEQMELVKEKAWVNTEKVLDLWARQLGADDVDVWYEKIRLVAEKGGPDVNELKREVYEEAIRTLKDDKKVAQLKKKLENF